MQYTPLKRREDIGLSPYELKFRGQNRSEEVEMTVFNIGANEVEEKKVESLEELKSIKENGTFIWVNINGLQNESLMGELAKILLIPEEILSDVMEPTTRPHMEEFNKGLFLSIKMIQFDDSKDEVMINNLSIVLMDNWLITFQEEKNDIFNIIKERIKKHNNRFNSLGADYLAFSLLDVVIDNYIFILEKLGEKIEEEDNRLVLHPNRDTLKIINTFKLQLSFLGRYIKPAKEMIYGLVKLESDFVNEQNYKHYKELHDNINQVVDLIDYYHGLLNDALNIYHSSMSSRLNDIMALLTIFSVVFIPLSFIVGVYGMNFDYIPELHTKYGYFIIWGVMIIIASAMLYFFKKKKWF